MIPPRHEAVSGAPSADWQALEVENCFSPTFSQPACSLTHPDRYITEGQWQLVIARDDRSSPRGFVSKQECLCVRACLTLCVWACIAALNERWRHGVRGLPAVFQPEYQEKKGPLLWVRLRDSDFQPALKNQRRHSFFSLLQFTAALILWITIKFIRLLVHSHKNYICLIVETTNLITCSVARLLTVSSLLWKCSQISNKRGSN